MMFLVFVFSLVASAFASPVMDSQLSRFENDAIVSDSPFLNIIKTKDVSARDVIYSTPTLMFIGTKDKLLRCIYEDPDECEVVFKSNSLVFSLHVAAEHIYAGLESGQLMWCDVNKKETCKTFQILDSVVRSLVAVGPYLYVGLYNGAILRCQINQPNSCESFHTVESRVFVLHNVNQYLYAGLSNGQLMRCSLTSMNSCIRLRNMESDVMGITTIGSSVAVLTFDNNLWNCSVNANSMLDICYSVPLISLNQMSEYPRALVSFNGKLFTLEDEKGVYACKWANDTDCSSFGNINNGISMVFAHGTYRMQGRYRNEDTTCTWQSSSMCPPAVVYYDTKQRALLEIHVKGGKLYNSLGFLVDTSDADTGRSGPAAIFVMGPDGRILLSNAHKKELIHTSSLLAGNPVSGAGEMVVKNGMIQKITSCSDHYRPDLNLNQQVVEALRTQGYSEHIDLQLCEENNDHQSVTLDQISYL